MKGLVFFILLVGAQLIASFPKELSIKDTEIKSQNSRQKRQDRPGLIDFSGTPPERPGLELPGFTIPPVELEDPEAALPKELFELLYPKPEGTEKPKPELPYPFGQIYQAMSKGQQKGGLDLDFGADLNLPEDVAKNADIDIGLRLNAMNFGMGDKGGDDGGRDEKDCSCIKELNGELNRVLDELGFISDTIEDLVGNAANASSGGVEGRVRSSSSLTVADSLGNDIRSTLSNLGRTECWRLGKYRCYYCCYYYYYYGHRNYYFCHYRNCYSGKRDTSAVSAEGEDEQRPGGINGFCLAGQFLDILAELTVNSNNARNVADQIDNSRDAAASIAKLNNLIPEINERADQISELKQQLEDSSC